MISVIIPSYRNPEYLDLCLKSAFENQDEENQIIVILDGFVDESRDVITKYPGLDVVEFENNRGQQVAHNTGVHFAESDKILIVNDDNVFPKGWDSNLLPHFAENLVITPNQIEPEPSIFKSFVIENLGTTPQDFQYKKFLHLEDTLINPTTLDGQTWPLFMSKKWYMALGGIDVNFPSAAVADWDFFLRCELAGLQCIRLNSIHFYHFAGAATKKRDSGWNQNEMNSFEYFEYKWGFHPSMKVSNHSKIPNQDVRGIQFSKYYS